MTMLSYIWGLVLILALAVSGWLLLAGGPFEDLHDEEDITFLLPVPLADITALDVLKAGRLIRYERSAEGIWFRHPDADIGNRAAHSHTAPIEAGNKITETLDMFSRARIERTLGPVADQRDAYGLAFPDMVLAAYRAESAQPAVRLEFGDLAPDGLSRYVLIVDHGQVVSIANYHLTNLAALVADPGV